MQTTYEQKQTQPTNATTDNEVKQRNESTKQTTNAKDKNQIVRQEAADNAVKRSN